MKNYLAIIYLILLGCASRGQNNTAISRVEYSSLSRSGYHEQIMITSDSVRVKRKMDRTETDEKTYTRRLHAQEWVLLLQSIGNVSMAEISEIKSPTMKRSFDGARHSSIIITGNNGISTQHAFDDESPHQQLALLMKYIRTIADKTVK